MTNIAFAKRILEKLFEAGVDEIILCPGARNAPFVEILAQWKNGRVHSFFEERSAAYFALGRIAESHRPKAIVTTSGTAVANLLPAVIEAHYTGAPLIAVTADRPRAYRGTGSPQTIVQPGIFSTYAPCFDLAKEDKLAFQISKQGPTQINICLDEPLIDEPVTPFAAKSHQVAFCSPPRCQNQPGGFADVARPFVVVGGLTNSARPAVLEWLRKQECPLYIEAPSGLRGHPALKHLELKAGEKTWKTKFFDGLIRVGHVPTARVWRDMEKSNLPVVSYSELPFTGSAREDAKLFDIHSLPEQPLKHAQTNEVLERDRHEWERLESLLASYPRSEPALVRAFSENVKSTDTLYLGNSLPIREWDMAAHRTATVENVFANRGVNGIDGQLSTFFGWARQHDETHNWALTGDLTALYDLSSPWALQKRPIEKFTIGIINNGGGRIFKPMFDQPLFENSHDVKFQAWAKMWNLEYANWRGDGKLPAAQIVEIEPDSQQTEAVKQKW